LSIQLKITKKIKVKTEDKTISFSKKFSFRTDLTLEYDIFGQHCHLPIRKFENLWRPTSFSVADAIYEQIKNDLFSTRIDNDIVFLCLFPIYADINKKKQIVMGQQNEEIYLPSTNPCTTYEFFQLQERFERMLFDEHALEIGLCQKRRRIYNDLFDELIRLITLQCSERGLLLSRIKNEYVQWMNTYEELYSSGMAYSLRQYLYKSQEKIIAEYRIEQFESDCKQLHEEIDRESMRYDRLTQLLVNDDEYEQNNEYRLLKTNANILRSTNEILRRDLQSTLNNILLSTIFLGEPIDYTKESE